MAKTTPSAAAAAKAPTAPTAPAPVAGPTAPPSAAPGTKAPEAKKEKKAKIQRKWHPIFQLDENGKPTNQIDAIPADFDPKVHKPIGRKQLKDDSLYFELQARKFDAKAAECRRQAEESKKLGGVKDKNSAKKLLQLQKRIDEVTKTLEGSGVDVAALLAMLKQKQDEKAPATTEPAKA